MSFDNNLTIKKMKKIIYILVFANYFCANATNYFVNSTTGNNLFNGLSVSTAKQTLGWFSYSTTFLHPGDTIFVMNGTYINGTVSGVLTLRASGSATNPLVITNYPGHAPFLKFNSWAGVSMSDSVHHIVINGLRIQGNNGNISLANALNQPGSCANPTGPSDGAYNGTGILIDGRTNGKHVHHITVRNCEVFDCGTGGIVSLQADYLTYENNLVYNNSWYTIYGGSGISNLNSWNYDNHSSTAYSMIIRNNVVYGNELLVPWVNAPCAITDGNGIIIDSQSNASTTLTPYSGKTLIENNIVYKNGGRGIHIYASANCNIKNNTCFFNGKSAAISGGEVTVITSTNVTVFNNIMYARTGENANSKNGSTTGLTFGNNLLFNHINSSATFTNISDIIGLNPQFIDTTVYNFKLQCSSPAVNAASTITSQYSAIDINGINRPLGIKPDIGAYEKTGVPTASIALTSNSVCVNQPINISASGINSPTSYSWTLSGGSPTSSNNQTTTITYTNSGTYSITLITANANCVSTNVTKTITVNALPNVTITASNSVICEGQSVTLNASGATTYTWTNGVSNGVTFTPTTTATYTVTGVDIYNCSNTSSISIIVNICTNTNTYNLYSATYLYPNPSSGFIIIENAKNNSNVEVYDIFGRKVFYETINTNKSQIDISFLTNGIYFVKIISSDNMLYTKSIYKE